MRSKQIQPSSNGAATASRARHAKPHVIGARRPRPRIESFLLALSADFVKAPADGVDRTIDVWLERLASFLDVDKIGLWERDVDGAIVHRQRFYSVPGLPVPSDTAGNDFPWLDEQFRLGRIVSWARVPEDIPSVASAERAEAIRVGAKSVLGIPIHNGGTICVLTLACVRAQRTWPKNLIHKLQLAAEIFSSAFVRQRTERSLVASESRNRAILRALPDLIFVLSPEEVFVEYHCPVPADLLMPPDKFVGRTMQEILPPEMARIFRAAFRKAAETGEVAEVEYVLPLRGEEAHFEARMVQRDDGATVVIVRNITERHRSAMRLSESEQRFRGAFSHSAIGIALVSLDGHWLQVNASLCRILGFSETELLATTFQALTHPDDLEPDLVNLRRTISGEISHYEMEKRYFHKNGRTVSAILTVSLVRKASGEPHYFVSQIQDVTERRQSQIEIEQARLELAHIGRLSLVAQLTASLAHELLQPITAVVSNAEAGLHTPGLASGAELRTVLADIASSGRRAGEIIHHVRSLLRNERAPHMKADLNRLIQEVAQVMRSDLLLHRVRLSMHLDPASSEISCNNVEIQQVLLNLMLNGTEAMREVSVLDRRLRVTTMAGEDGIELSVQDSGTGAAPDLLDRLFEPFFTTKPGGMGMGLSICAEIMRAHGGRLWAENNPDNGMTFRCLFPRC